MVKNKELAENHSRIIRNQRILADKLDSVQNNQMFLDGKLDKILELQKDNHRRNQLQLDEITKELKIIKLDPEKKSSWNLM